LRNTYLIFNLVWTYFNGCGSWFIGILFGILAILPGNKDLNLRHDDH